MSLQAFKEVISSGKHSFCINLTMSSAARLSSPLLKGAGLEDVSQRDRPRKYDLYLRNHANNLVILNQELQDANLFKMDSFVSTELIAKTRDSSSI